MDELQKVLIVDDVPSNILVLSEILQDDYEIFFATDGAQCLELAGTEQPDLILLDVMMPGLDGYEVCKQLKNNHQTKNIPVIFVSALGDVEDETKGLELGAIDYIVKPVSPPIVKARVKNHLELKKYRDLLENMSLRDGLTGIANRRHFDDVLAVEWRRAGRNNDQLALIMIDIDLFKKYNDFYGHLAGDDCLRKVAAAIKNSVKRAGELAARYGGEEFAVLLPVTNLDSAAEAGEMIRKNVEALQLPHEASDISSYVTISVGAAALGPDSGASPDALIKKADQALYQAKNEGRNRVVCAVN